MVFKFLIVSLCFFYLPTFGANTHKNTLNESLNSLTGKIIERHLMQSGDWNLLVEITTENQNTVGWVYYDPETDYKNWIFFDSDNDPTKNLALAETLTILRAKPNSDFLKATANFGKYELIKPLSEEDDFSINGFGKTLPKADQKKSAYPLVPDRKNWSLGCTQFIDEQANINSWGLTVIAAVNKYPEFLLSVSQDMVNYCPNFLKFNKSERENFWVWFIAAMAMRESGCRPDAKSKGPNGIAAGLLQLHLHKEYAYHQDCKTTNALQPTQNLSCGSAMLDAQLVRYNRMFLAKGSYWEVLQTDSSGNGMRKLVSLYRPCH